MKVQALMRGNQQRRAVSAKPPPLNPHVAHPGVKGVAHPGMKATVARLPAGLRWDRRTCGQEGG